MGSLLLLLLRRPQMAPLGPTILSLSSNPPKRFKATATATASPSHPPTSAAPHQPVRKIEMPASIMASLPGPPSYPLIKALPYLQKAGGLSNFHVYLENLRRDYGWVSKVELPFTSAPMLFHPDDIRLAYATDGKYPAMSIDGTPILIELYRKRGVEAKTLTTAENEEWKRLRNALQKHILVPKAAVSYLPLLNPVSRDLSSQLPRFQDNLKEIIPRFTFEGIASVLFGKRLGALTQTTLPEDELFMKYALEFIPELRELTFNSTWKWFETPGYKRFLSKHAYLNDRGLFYAQELTKKIQEDPDRYSQAFLARMLASKELSLEEIAISVAILFIGGVDTTANTLLWLLLHLASNPEAQEKLHQELTSVLKGGDYDESLSNHLPYMKACFRESNRLDTVSFLLSRRLQKDLSLPSGYTFPAGSTVMLSPATNFRDPRYFERPDDFVPERWLEEAQAKRAAEGNTFADHPMLHVPFSFGARMCLGARFAGVEMNSMIARVVQDYRFEIAPGQPPYKRVFKMLMMPESFPNFRFHPRK